MSVKIRMTRIGRHKDPIYRIVASDSRFARDGRYAEQVGYFDPATNKVHLEEELIMKWLKAGATPSDSIKTILTEAGIIAKFNATKGPSHKKSKTVKKNKFDRPAKPKVKKEPVKPIPNVKKEDIKGDVKVATNKQPETKPEEKKGE